MSGRALIGVAALVAAAAPAAAQPYGHWMGDWGGFYWPFGMILWPLILIGLVVLAVWAVRTISAPPPVPPPPPRRSPGLDVLEERYARGEIGRDEYLQKKTDLGG